MLNNYGSDYVFENPNVVQVKSFIRKFRCRLVDNLNKGGMVNGKGQDGWQLAILSWNVNILSQSRIDDPSFVDVLLKYDICFLLETWTNSSRYISLNGYISHNLWRKFQNKNARRCRYLSLWMLCLVRRFTCIQYHKCIFFYLLDNVISIYVNKGRVLICGDFNSKIRWLSYFCIHDVVKRFIYDVDYDSDMYSVRASVDRSHNNRGI